MPDPKETVSHKPVMLDWEAPEELLLERDALEAHIAQLLAEQSTGSGKIDKNL